MQGREKYLASEGCIEFCILNKESKWQYLQSTSGAKNLIGGLLADFHHMCESRHYICFELTDLKNQSKGAMLISSSSKLVSGENKSGAIAMKCDS